MKSKKLFLLALLSFLPFVSTNAFAVACYYSSGADVNLDLSSTFNSSNNLQGTQVELVRQFTSQVWAKCPPFTPPNESEKNITYRTYVTTLPISEVIDSWKYLNVNDYIDVATKITDNQGSIQVPFYPPVNHFKMGESHYVSEFNPFPVADRNFTFRVRIKRPFINYVNINTKLFDVYVNTNYGESLGPVVYRITLSGIINVPQTCVLNTDQIIEFDFGEIGAQLFSRAGAGNPALYINPMTKAVDIKCTNIAAGTAQLALRVEAENTNGNIIVSDNADVGFKMSAPDINGTQHTFIPNNINDRIGFKLDDSGRGNVNITVVPVSVTGNMPQPGIFTARGYLRVDFF
ncbi:fimbrial protein [Providencia rettgeri]|uniref:fimbrial protein n=1 Tax=Providencia rettgeri TaxID=587 RepID=UPI001EE6CB62|nr:fimbrial protein [Providencia rettgeri]MCG5282177.1 fimbrial protein [Providencia rettgeri]